MELSRPISYIAFVSWPRSGHHLLVRLLQQITGGKLKYCQFYNKSKSPDCCDTFPCINPQINFSKQHDFKLDAPIVKGVCYLVQYRDFLPSLVSNFELYIAKNADRDRPSEFRKFALVQATQYRGFVSKWVRGASDGKIVVKYENLMREPEPVLLEIVGLYGIEVRPAEISEHLRQIEHHSIVAGKLKVDARRGVFEARKLETFRFYDGPLFDMLLQRSQQ